MSPRKYFVEIGQRFGSGIVTDPEIRIPRRGRHERGARLRCDCGGEYAARLEHLREGRVSSCGCELGGSRKDRTGIRYGKLVAIRYVESVPIGAHGGLVPKWLCRCDCGGEKSVLSSSLDSGGTFSCGCARRGLRIGGPPWLPVATYIRGDYQTKAHQRGLAWELSEDEFNRLIQDVCHYCGAAPGNIQTRKSTYSERTLVYNGLDRVDNDLGYTLDNVVACCRMCNTAKNKWPLEKWLAWMRRLALTYFSNLTEEEQAKFILEAGTAENLDSPETDIAA